MLADPEAAQEAAGGPRGGVTKRMTCPYCGANEDRVIDSREASDGGRLDSVISADVFSSLDDSSAIILEA